MFNKNDTTVKPEKARNFEDTDEITKLREEWAEKRRNKYKYEALDTVVSVLKGTKADALGHLSLKNFYLLHVLEDGLEKFTDSMINHWQNTAVVAALIGAIDATLLLTGISTSDAFNTSGEIPTEENALLIARVYYVLWSISGISNIACVLLDLILAVHFTDLMLGDNDKIWFILTWGDVFNVPDVLLTVGSLSFLAACSLGSFLVADKLVGYIASAVITTGVVLFLALWISMLRRNLEKQQIHYQESVNSLVDMKIE